MLLPEFSSSFIALLFSFSFLPVGFAQLCSSLNGLGKCSSNVFSCVFQNGYPNYFKANASTGDCAQDEFCCLNLARPEDGSCAQRCGMSGTARQKASESIKLDKNYNWDSLAQERSARIVNGTATDKFEFCWQGGVFVVDTDQLQNNSRTAVPIYVGGASLVGQDMALTAAHVLQPFITNANFIIFVAFGFRNIGDVIDIMNQSRPFNFEETPIFRVPNEMAFHSGYNDRTYENNVAIIRFNPLSCETANICPICLSPTPANPFQPWKGTCFTSGWGATSNSSVSPTLQKLEMVIPYPNECIKSFMKLGLKNYELPSTMLCADSAPGQRGGTCDRDGGSPLVCQTKYGNWELTGIVGVGINRCRVVAAPTLFTNVGYYYEWIQSYTKGIYQGADDQTTTTTSTTAPSTPATTTAADQPLFPDTTASTSTSARLNSTFNTPTVYLAPIQPSRFQFSPPKVFLPKPSPPLDEQQKKVLAFFQERTDDSQPRLPIQVVNRPTLGTTPPAAPESTSTGTPSTISTASTSAIVFNSNAIKKMDNVITDASSGSVKFFMSAGDGLIRRKTVENPELRNGPAMIPLPKLTIPVPVSTAPAATLVTSTSTPSTTTAPTSPPSTASTTSTTTTQTTTTVTQSSSTARSTASAKTEQTTTAVWQSWQPDTDNSSSSWKANSISNSGWNKIVFRIRPNQDNPSILALLRERYKNSKLYTDAPSNVTTALPTSPKTAAATMSTRTTAKLTSTTPATKVTSPTTTVSTTTGLASARPTAGVFSNKTLVLPGAKSNDIPLAPTEGTTPGTKSIIKSTVKATKDTKDTKGTKEAVKAQATTVAMTSNPTTTTVATSPSTSGATTVAGHPSSATVIISGTQLANLQATLAKMLRNETLETRPIGNSVMM